MSGLKVSILESRSSARGFAFGKSELQDCFDLLGSDLMYLRAFSFPI